MEVRYSFVLGQIKRRSHLRQYVQYYHIMMCVIVLTKTLMAYIILFLSSVLYNENNTNTSLSLPSRIGWPIRYIWAQPTSDMFPQSLLFTYQNSRVLLIYRLCTTTDYENSTECGLEWPVMHSIQQIYRTHWTIKNEKTVIKIGKIKSSNIFNEPKDVYTVDALGTAHSACESLSLYFFTLIKERRCINFLSVQ